MLNARISLKTMCDTKFNENYDLRQICYLANGNNIGVEECFDGI